MKKKAETFILSESHLPDVLMETDAGNWGMDTFPDVAKGMGVLNHEVLGDPKSPPTLPDGVAIDASEDGYVSYGALGDLDELTREASLQDLSWLEFAEQDPDRLPVNPVDKSIPELEEAWGTRRRTNGLEIVPNTDLDSLRYEETLSQLGRTATMTQKEMVHILRKAWLKVTAGMAFKPVASEANARLGHDAYRAKEILAMIQDDAGLIGKVFIRASNYPNCGNGNWTANVKKEAAKAKYVVEKKACGGCVHAQKGSCALFQKQLVANVPWEKAAKHYTPLLVATGRKVASDISPKEALRNAFAQNPHQQKQFQDDRPHHMVASDRISLDAARKEHDAAPAFKVKSIAASADEAKAHVTRWKNSGLLSVVNANRLLASNASGPAILRVATTLISAVKEGSYLGGSLSDHMATDEEVQAAIAASKKEAQEAQSRVTQEAEKRAHDATRVGRMEAAVRLKAAKVASAIEKGVRGKPLANMIKSLITKEESRFASTLLSPLLKKTSALSEEHSGPNKYQGALYTQAIVEKAAKTGPAHGETERLVRWARQQMSEGWVGKDLTDILRGRFASSIRTASAPALDAIRATHEGLSGHLYVDAEAYASRQGMDGCTKAASKHRANAIPTVMEMDRCGGCVARHALSDGTPTCSVYNKVLVASVPHKNPAAYQKEVIRLKNGADADRVASLFAPTYDPEEYRLGEESELDDIHIEDAPENEVLGEIFFGGLEF